MHDSGHHMYIRIAAHTKTTESYNAPWPLELVLNLDLKIVYIFLMQENLWYMQASVDCWCNLKGMS